MPELVKIDELEKPLTQSLLGWILVYAMSAYSKSLGCETLHEVHGWEDLEELEISFRVNGVEIPIVDLLKYRAKPIIESKIAEVAETIFQKHLAKITKSLSLAARELITTTTSGKQ